MDFDALVLDIDGVLTVGWQPLPGAPETFAELRRRGLPFRLATNTTSRSRSDLAATLGEAGFDVEPDEILTAPRATATFLQETHPGARVFLLSTGDLSEDLADVELVGEGEPADVVVLGGAGLAYTHTQLNNAFNLILDGADFVAMHRNLYWRTAAGLELDTGAYAMALEAATGRTPTLIGKPAEAFFAAAISELGTAAGTTLMVGDDIENDVIGAQRCGLRGCLVQTGKYRADAVSALEPEMPDYVIPSFADLFTSVVDAPHA